jgi:uncharacterized protein YlxP (DUF503 family)
MIIGTCILTLSIPGARSLKDKRQVVRSIIARVRNEYNVAIAEVADQDRWQQAVIGMACVSTTQNHAHDQIQTVLHFIERTRPDIPVIDAAIEML